jgi:hypothetical protein
VISSASSCPRLVLPAAVNPSMPSWDMTQECTRRDDLRLRSRTVSVMDHEHPMQSPVRGSNWPSVQTVPAPPIRAASTDSIPAKATRLGSPAAPPGDPLGVELRKRAYRTVGHRVGHRHLHGGGRATFGQSSATNKHGGQSRSRHGQSNSSQDNPDSRNL